MKYTQTQKQGRLSGLFPALKQLFDRARLVVFFSPDERLVNATPKLTSTPKQLFCQRVEKQTSWLRVEQFEGEESSDFTSY